MVHRKQYGLYQPIIWKTNDYCTSSNSYCIIKNVLLCLVCNNIPRMQQSVFVFGKASINQRYRKLYIIINVQHVTQTADTRTLLEGPVLYFGKRPRSSTQQPIPARSPVTVMVVVHNGSSGLSLTYPTTSKSMVCYLPIATSGSSYEASKMVLLML